VANILNLSHNNFAGFLELLQLNLTQLLVGSRESRSEFELIRELSAPPYSLFQADCLRNSLSMYRVHFMLFHALYQLRDQFHLEQLGSLEISPLRIQLTPYLPGKEGVAEADPLRDFYLNWDNFEYTQEDVDSLLNNFWKQAAPPLKPQEQQEALRILELEEPVDYSTLKRQYRRLAMKHHPDRGGDAEELKRINAAMALLSNLYRTR